MLAFGAAVGLMLLARTMAVGFLPAIVVATAIVVVWDRRTLANLALAGGAALAVAAPWWISSRDALYDYLFGFGYGRISQHYGASGVVERIETRWRNLGEDLRVLRWVGLAILVAIAGGALVRTIRARGGPGDVATRPHGDRLDRRSTLAVAALVLVGYLTLLTTRNQGVWFELPLELLLVGVVVAFAARLGRPRWILEGAALCVAAATLGISMTDSGGDLPLDVNQRTFHQTVQAELYGGLIDKERPLTDADPALLSQDPAERGATAREWWEANIEVADTIERYRRDAGGLLSVSMSGNSHLINGQSILLTQELRTMPPAPLEVPDTASSTSELREHLTPMRWGTHERILVLIRSRSLPFPEDRDVPRLRHLAEDQGWQLDDSVALPDGGDVLFLRLPRP
jgi:hypothetical protein